MKTKLITLTLTLMLIATMAMSQGRLIRGQVSSVEGNPLAGIVIVLKGTLTQTITDRQGVYLLTVPDAGGILVFSGVGMVSQEVKIEKSDVINVTLRPSAGPMEEKVIAQPAPGRIKKEHANAMGERYDMAYAPSLQDEQVPPWNTEEYDAINENQFHGALQNPLSTFSIDVDAASYSNIRRYINNGQRPPKDAVRIEEMINYFTYDYAQPRGDDPFSIYTEISRAPWNEKHKLVHIGLQGRKVPTENLPPSNLVFLLDVSGSMEQPNKLPLLKASFKLLVNQLREQDRVAIVVYAGAAGLVLPSTPGSDKRAILEALDKLQAGGSTAGGAGIKLAYEVAKANYKPGGNNRVIIATDGDFNIGESSNAAMERLIEDKREQGVFLTVLGFGMGNYKDSKMEILADKGNGNYAYIDNILEAQKVLVNEFGGTLFTIAKDVKLQIEFNPAKVQAYRLIGYENRILHHEDFNNDKKDAGDLGSGHTVTALYEIIPVGVESDFFKMDPLKYQQTKLDPLANRTNELMTVKFRYKDPAEKVSKLMVHTVRDENKPLAKTSDNFRWSASVAAFGMMLRDSEYINHYGVDALLQLAQSSMGKDEQGYRLEFVNLIKSQSFLAKK